MIRLFDVQNGKVIPTEHCYTMLCYKQLMDNYPKDYLSIYAYLFYMACPSPDLNPFFDVPEVDKEELIRREVGGDFDSDDELISNALDVTKKLLSKAGLFMANEPESVNSSLADEDEEIDPDIIHAALEKSQQASVMPPINFKTEKPKRRYFKKKPKA